VAAGVDIKRTASFDINSATLITESRRSQPRDFHDVMQGLPMPAVVLNPGGIVVSANGAFADLVQVDRGEIIGEPFLTWIGRSGDREAFGREFMNMKRRKSGHSFVRELSLVAALGPPTSRSVRVNKLDGGHLLVTCDRPAAQGDAQTELGRAVTRALDALEQGVVLVDSSATIVHANPAARTLLGDGIVGRTLLQLVRPGDVDGLSRALSLARAGSWQGELDLLRLDGEPIPVELSLAAAVGDGAPAVVLFRDLRARRRREFEERLVALLDRALLSSSEPREAVCAACQSLVTGLDARRAVILTHIGGGWERWESRVGAAPTTVRIEAGAQPPKGWMAKEEPELLPGADPVHEALFGPFERDSAGLRVTLRAPGGVVGYLLVTYDGRDDSWGAHEMGLITQLATQLALGLANGLLMLETRALAAYQGRILDQSAVVLNSVDAEGKIITWNRASERLLGIGADEAKGKRFGTEVGTARNPEFWRELWAKLEREGVFTSEITLVDAEGNDVPLHMEGRLLREGRVVTGAVLVGLDLRARRALEGQVLRTQKLASVGLLAAGIAHEINNPLSGVVGYSKLLLEKELPDNVRERVERIAASGERCRKIVEGVLLFSRQQGGERRRVNLQQLLDRVTRIGEYQWKMHNVRILRDVDEPAEIMADADQIEQVLLNLLSNAVDAMERGGSIHLELRKTEDDGASLSIADEGTGIPAEVLPSIFDPFFSTKDIGKGTGLGLSISYGIVRDHGGDILVQSKPGLGTTFTIKLPADGTPR